MSDAAIWAEFGSDLLVVAGFFGGLAAWLAQDKEHFRSYVVTALIMACLGAIFWAWKLPSTLATACVFSLLLALLMRWHYELRVLDLSLCAWVLVLGFVGHLHAWWPPIGPEAMPIVAYWQSLWAQCLGCALGAWSMTIMCQGAWLAQGPRALPQGVLGSDIQDMGRISAWLWCAFAALAAMAKLMAVAHAPVAFLALGALGLTLLLAIGGGLELILARQQAAARLKPQSQWAWMLPTFSALAWLALLGLAYFPEL